MLFIKKYFFKSRRKFVEKILIKFKKVSIDKIYDLITKECKEKGIVYDTLLKNKNQIILKAEYKNKSCIIKFHKTLAVSLHEYENLENLFYLYKTDRAYYITTGVFQQDVYNKNYGVLLQKHVVLINGNGFIKKQAWIHLKDGQHIRYNILSFKKYLPK